MMNEVLDMSTRFEQLLLVVLARDESFSAPKKAMKHIDNVFPSGKRVRSLAC